MNINDYQSKATSTAIYPQVGPLGLGYPTGKLCGEVGEFSEKLWKLARDKNALTPTDFVTHEAKVELAKELGDILWYVSACATELKYTLEEIAVMNLEKLNSRKERGTLGGSGDNR